MNLDLFNNLINEVKENNIIQSFIKELREFLENNFSEENLLSNERNQTPLLEKMLNGRHLTVKYRDKINLEKVNILSNYAKQTTDKGNLYYIYSKSSDNDNSYILGIYSKNKEEEIEIEVEESKLPKGAGVNSILRQKNGRFVLDEETTEEVENEMTKMINTLLEEQEQMLEKQRVEEHFYEFVEAGGNTVWLIDITNYTGKCIEEFDFPQEVLDNVKQGDIFQYVNGEYRLTSNTSLVTS